MKNDIYRAFLNSMKRTAGMMRSREIRCPLRMSSCVVCGQHKPTLPVKDVGAVCLDCSQRKN